MTRAARMLCLALTVLLSGAVGGRVEASPMAPEDCERARTEQAGLASAGASGDMAKGAEWARANLPPERLQRVARWIELEEQIQFRCPRPKPPKGSETAARGREEADAPAAGATAKPRLRPKKSDEAAGDADSPALQAAKPKPRPPAKKKPKVEDAYRPPAPFAGEELQHAAPGLSVPASPGAAGLQP